MTLELNLQRGLVGHWTMNDEDINDGVLYDSSAYGNFEYISSGVTTGVDSPIGNAHNFDGSSKHDFGDKTELQPVDEWTLSCWVRTTDGSDGFGITGSANFQDGGYFLAVDNGLAGVIANDSSSQHRIDGGGVLDDGLWHHILGTFDGSTMYLYLDASVQGSQTASVTTNSSPFYIGSTPQGGWEPLPGDISDCRLYSRHMTKSEVTQIYQMRNQRYAYL